MAEEGFIPRAAWYLQRIPMLCLLSYTCYTWRYLLSGVLISYTVYILIKNLVQCSFAICRALHSSAKLLSRIVLLRKVIVAHCTPPQSYCRALHSIVTLTPLQVAILTDTTKLPKAAFPLLTFLDLWMGLAKLSSMLSIDLCYTRALLNAVMVKQGELCPTTDVKIEQVQLL